MTKAEIICDSVSPDGVRLTTFVVTFHRFVLAELNTHRVFSRNSASSRAVPVKKMLERVKDDPAVPIAWGTNKPGMQAGEELQGVERDEAIHCYRESRFYARNAAYNLTENLNLHKQVANRLLEPFLWHIAIITAVDFDNYFWQRCHPDAQPEMKALADAMQLAYYQHTPVRLKYGEWHLPFITSAERAALLPANIEQVKQVSTARCARVSFLQHDGTRDWSKDLDLFEKLVGGMHPSPFEHAATPCDHGTTIKAYEGTFDYDSLQVACRLTGNFGHGWHQYRKFFSWENRMPLFQTYQNYKIQKVVYE